MITCDHVYKLKAKGLIDVYQYYNNIESPCIVTAEDQNGKVLVEIKFDNEDHFERVLGTYDPYNDTKQGENFLDIYYRNNREVK